MKIREDTNRIIEVKAKVKSVAIGDSITYGYPYGQQYSWVQLAAKRLGITIINRGEPGETTGEMAARFERDVISIKPEYVIILGGTNDAFYSIPEGFVRNNIYKMTVMAQQTGIKLIIALPIPTNEAPANTLLTKYRDWMREFALQNNYSIIDFYSITVDENTGFIKQGYHEDGVHPSHIAYEAMSKIVKIE